jgi:replicative DNA helicase
MFLHEDKSLPDPPSGMKKIILKIAKNRHGPERQIKLMFNRAFLEFTEMKEHFAPAPREVAEHWEGGED